MTWTTKADTQLDRVLSVVSEQLMVDPAWITSTAHARRPQAAFARKLFVFAAVFYERASQRRVAQYLDVDEKTVQRLYGGYTDAGGTRQPGGLALVQESVPAMQLACRIGEEIRNA